MAVVRRGPAAGAPVRVDARWWQRLFGRQPKQNAFAELFERVAEQGAHSVDADVLSEVRRRFRLSDSEERQGLEDLYAALVRRAVVDRRVTDVEKSDLEHLRGVFGISPSSARTIYGEIAGGIYGAEFKRAIEDRSITPAEKEQLEQLAADLQLPAGTLAALRNEELGKVIRRVVDRSIEDRRLSREEDEQLRAISADLGVVVHHDARTSRALDRYRLLWRIENGELPSLEVPVQLQRGEICHATLDSTLFEPRVVTRSVGYHGPRLRLRIAKGVYWNAGRAFLSPDRREEWKALDTGTLYITSKRLVFDGSTKSTSLLWKRVLDFEVYEDGIRIEKDSGRDQLFKTESADMELIGAIVEAARRRAAE